MIIVCKCTVAAHTEAVGLGHYAGLRVNGVPGRAAILKSIQSRLPTSAIVLDLAGGPGALSNEDFANKLAR